MMSKRGFTLLEVLVALVVIAVGLLALVKLNIIYTRANAFAHKLSQANTLAQSKMEELRRFSGSDRSDDYSPFDFDYLVSDKVIFASIEDAVQSPNPIPVAGLLAGSNGGIPVVTTWGTEYPVLFDDGSPIHGDAAANDGIYSMKERVNVAGGLVRGGQAAPVNLDLVWTVEPFSPPAGGPPTFAHVTVDVSWPKLGAAAGATHNVNLESWVYRRQ